MDLSDGCGRCYTRDELALLAGDPEAVPDRLLASATSDACDHWSPEQWRFLYRRFAPRLITLLHAGDCDRTLLLRGFGPSYADLASWPDSERRATEAALTDVLLQLLENEPADELVRLLGGLACAYDDLRPWLARLDAARGPAAEGGVVRLALRWITDLLWDEDDWFSWWYADDPVTPVRDWTINAKHLERGKDSPWPYPGYAWDWWQRRGLPGSYGWLAPAGRTGSRAGVRRHHGRTLNAGAGQCVTMPTVTT